MLSTWKLFDCCFKLVCILITVGLIVWCCYNYYLDEDETVVSFRPFYDTPIDVYPTTSICFTCPFENKKVKKYSNDITPCNYAQFLSGDIWKDDMPKIDYNAILLEPKDYILGYEILYRNISRVSKTYNLNEKNNEEGLVLPFTRFNTSHMTCFGIDIQLQREVLAWSIKIYTKIFDDGIRPNAFDDPSLGSRQLHVLLHYPNQIFRTKWWKTNWPTRNANSSKNYLISYDVRGMEVVRYRNKRAQKCNDGFPNYDESILKDIMDSVGCRPPYATSFNNLSLCTNQNQIKKIHYSLFEHWQGDNLNHLPCSGMEKLTYDVTESDEKETQPPYFTISFNLKDLTYKEIRMKRSYDFQVLIGNIGGFIGMFLGYALLMVPGMFKVLFNQLCFWFKKKADDKHRTELPDREENAAGKLQIQIDSIYKALCELQDKVTSMNEVKA